jgi:flavin reductase (DIM6/NTAB) family NADH-FMN oxidoreductase RutF
MRKELSISPAIYPQPVLMLATYNEDGTVDVMNAAWGGAVDTDLVGISLTPTHRTCENFRRTKGFTVSLPTAKYIKEADYFGIESGAKAKDKFERTGLHTEKAKTVDAPVILEFPLCLECEYAGVDEYGVVFGKILRVTADESVLDEKGNIDIAKCDGVLFDNSTGRYFRIGEFLAKAFSCGMVYKKK